MKLWVVLGLFALRAGLGQEQDAGGGIHGSVLSLKWPVAKAHVELIEQRDGTPHLTSTATDGSYRLERLQRGTYNLKISALGFLSTEVRDVQIDGVGTRVLPTVRLEVGPIADCASERRPDYYRPLPGPSEMGAVGGTVTNANGVLIPGANVTLFMRGKGKLSSQITKPDGTFSFAGVEVRPEEYWITVSREGYFSEELSHLTLLPGFETVYAPITMEACSPGRCQPNLKTIRIIPGCA